MLGTFKPGDLLKVEDFPIEKIKTGDVIVFRDNEDAIKDDFMVHRVVKKKSGRLITRGDSNPHVDNAAVSSSQLIGRIAGFSRKGKTRHLKNGRAGLIWAALINFHLRFKKLAAVILRPTYRWMKRSGIVAKIWRPEIEAIYFETQDGPLVKYVHKGKTVASCWLDSNRWWFRRPYDFVIGPKLKNGKQS